MTSEIIHQWPPEPGAWTQFFDMKRWTFVTFAGYEFNLRFDDESDEWVCSGMVAPHDVSVTSPDRTAALTAAWKVFSPDCPRDVWMAVPDWTGYE